jgi:hypothetical protein
MELSAVVDIARRVGMMWPHELLAPNFQLITILAPVTFRSKMRPTQILSYLCEIILNLQGRDLIIPEQRLDGCCSGASTATVLITGRQVTACDSHGMGEGPSES